MQDESATPFIAELAATVRERSRGPVIVVAEDPRNLACLLIDRCKGGWGLDAAWADDFHHQVRVHVAHDHEGYYRDFTGTTADIATTVRQGWFFTGQHSTHTGGSRGTDPFAVAPPQFVICIQNHDQIGNRADGARLNHEIDAATFRAASTLLLLAPQTPLIFMGQEWACASPFQFFTDHNQELGRLITIGRREEFRCFATFTDPGPVYVPDPQAEETFIRSRLSWSELHTEPHASMLRLYQRLLALRATSPALGTTSRDAYDARALDGETVLIVRHTPDHRERIATVVRLGGGGLVVFDDARAHWQVFLTTEDHDVAPDAMPIEVTASDAIDIRFHRPGAVVLRGHPES
jgi:maltooligosyltrehalose trehalohydrolase